MKGATLKDRTIMTKTVFVTGGAGYVGSHCCKAFAKAGWEVVSFDNLSRGWRDLVKWGPLIEGDLLARDAIGEALKAVQSHKITVFPGVPTMFAAINNAPNVGDYDLTSLKFCGSGGAPLPVES